MVMAMDTKDAFMPHIFKKHSHLIFLILSMTSSATNEQLLLAITRGGGGGGKRSNGRRRLTSLRIMQFVNNNAQFINDSRIFPALCSRS